MPNGIKSFPKIHKRTHISRQIIIWYFVLKCITKLCHAYVMICKTNNFRFAANLAVVDATFSTKKNAYSILLCQFQYYNSNYNLSNTRIVLSWISSKNQWFLIALPVTMASITTGLISKIFFSDFYRFCQPPE